MDKLLAMKIYNVMNKTEALTKDMTVGKAANAYKAISEATVLNEIKPLLKEFKLIIFPCKTIAKEITETYPDPYDKNKTKIKSITQLVVTFTLADAETGESIDIEVAGNGYDSLDKGTGKATTYAYKTALQKTFMLFSGEDTDNSHSDDVTGTNEAETVAKITTSMLTDALIAAGSNAEELLETYNKKTGKNIKELKFMTQEYKLHYYERMTKKEK